jgi:adhesin transport system outer membrane protein
MKRARFLRVAALCAVACFCGPFDVRANSLEEMIAETVETHDRLLASQAQVTAARQRSKEALGVWYPSLDVTANVERYRLERTNTDTVIAPAQELTATITQLLWDFGGANATVERARLQLVQSEISLVLARQTLIAEALAAYINLLRSAEVVLFARRSEENIRRQTGLEEARIEAGSGLSTDLLQAKTQLAGAQARRVDAEGGYELALNRYRAVFGDVPADIAALPGMQIDASGLPDTLEHALDLAFKGNPDLRLTSIDVSLSQQDRISARSESFAPTFEVVGERTMTKNDGGTIGRRTESSIKLEMNFPFNLGFTSINTLRAAQSDVVAATRTMGDLKRQVEERVRNAWKQLETARQRSGYLFDQAGIARAFLEVAIQERQLGQRSLIDVLSGETSLINAQSDAIAAEAEVQLALIELLAASGSLDYSVIETVPRPDRSEMLAPIAGLFGDTTDPSMQLLSPGGDLGDSLDPSALIDGGTPSDGVFTPPPDGNPVLDTTPLVPSEPQAPLEPPLSTLTPDAPIIETPPPAAPVEDAAPPETPNYLDSLQEPPSFDTLPYPEPPSEPARAEGVEDTSGAAAPAPESQPAPASPPAGTRRDDGELDNPLFDWAQ